jgi:hypothetical protein
MFPVPVRVRPSLEPLADRLVPAVMPLAPAAIPAPDPGTDPPVLSSPTAQPADPTLGPVVVTDAGGLTPPQVAEQPGPVITPAVMPNQPPADGGTAPGELTIYPAPTGPGLVHGGWSAGEPTFTGGVYVG